MDDRELKIMKIKAELFDLQAEAFSVQAKLSKKGNELKSLLNEESDDNAGS